MFHTFNINIIHIMSKFSKFINFIYVLPYILDWFHSFIKFSHIIIDVFYKFNISKNDQKRIKILDKFYNEKITIKSFSENDGPTISPIAASSFAEPPNVIW